MTNVICNKAGLICFISERDAYSQFDVVLYVKTMFSLLLFILIICKGKELALPIELRNK